ncbi:MAG: tRNA pseudouridine(55) synthase TruB [Acholeplasma sp.]|nr:tRNA pseudouridine(55) synthase TruB [Acholeplasma sp.]
MDGIILINKPTGITSYDVVRKAKKVFNTTKIGHTGTLDPFAEGLMILCVGKATKLSNRILDSDKEYEGTIVFNHHYDTYDVTGKVINSDNKHITFEELLHISKEFSGKMEQIPPIYSAIKKDGKKLYEYARKGIDINVDSRIINIKNFEILNEESYNTFSFRTVVSKGTYIRSLAVDIASKLNTFGALSKLKRTKLGDYSLLDAIQLDDLTTDNLVEIAKLYPNNPSLVVDDYIAKLVKNGVYLDERQINTEQEFLVYNDNQELIALYEPIGDNKYRPVIIF